MENSTLGIGGLAGVIVHFLFFFAKIAQVVDEILHVPAVITHVAAKSGIACLKAVLSFSWIFNVENTLDKKHSKNF